MNRLHALAMLLFALGLCAPFALAQSSTYILGVDTGTDGGNPPTRRIQVDSQGRLVVALSGGGTITDAGVVVTVPYCTGTRNYNTAVGTSPAVNLPVTGGRWMTRVCNSPRNSGTPIITCTTDGVVPDAGLNGMGESLEVGDCAVYMGPNVVACISDTALTSVSSWDCK